MRTGKPIKNKREPFQDAMGRSRTLETTKVRLGKDRVLGISQDVTERIEHDQREYANRVARTIGHSMNNWIPLLSGRISRLESNFPSLHAEPDFTELREIARALADLGRRMKLSVLGGGGRRDVILVNEAIAEVVRLAYDPRVTVELNTEPLRCDGDRGYFREAMMEMLSNATRHAVEGIGKVKVVAYRGGSRIRIEVSNDGDRISEALRAIDEDGNQLIFRPFETTDRARMGIGMSIVREVIGACGGSITVGEAEQGACFLIDLPEHKDTENEF